MIVRISGEDQYRLADSDGEIAELDTAVVKAIESGDESAFETTYKALIDHVRGGERVSDDELAPSNLILPPADLTFDEAKGEFTGEGLIPD
jgi:hypothetical protein